MKEKDSIFWIWTKCVLKKAIENILCHQICKDMSMENPAKGDAYMNFMLWVSTKYISLTLFWLNLCDIHLLCKNKEI